MINICIGYDEKEPIAYHVLAHSILKRSSQPVSITPLNRTNLKTSFWRPRGELDSTDFSNSRWIVPHLCAFDGYAIFMDCDMLCLGDIADLWAQKEHKYAVKVVKHDHIPKETTKFLGQQQSQYSMKNWSSLMLFNNWKCKALRPPQVNTKHGLWMHQFEWCDHEEIGEIEGGWNHLVGYDDYIPNSPLPHFTLGGPWHGYNDSPYADLWWQEYDAMIRGGNPVDYLEIKYGPDSIKGRAQ